MQEWPFAPFVFTAPYWLPLLPPPPPFFFFFVVVVVLCSWVSEGKVTLGAQRRRFWSCCGGDFSLAVVTLIIVLDNIKRAHMERQFSSTLLNVIHICINIFTFRYIFIYVCV